MIVRLAHSEQFTGSLSGDCKQRLSLGSCTLPNPELLLLHEPTSGVDPTSRREFWREIHAFPEESLSVLVSAHYMDEAERRHEIAYVAHGELLAHGTVDEVLSRATLTTFVVSESNLPALAKRLAVSPGVDSVAPFGASLDVSAPDGSALETTLAPYRNDPRLVWMRSTPSLKDLFIELRTGAEGRPQ